MVSSGFISRLLESFGYVQQVFEPYQRSLLASYGCIWLQVSVGFTPLCVGCRENPRPHSQSWFLSVPIEEFELQCWAGFMGCCVMLHCPVYNWRLAPSTHPLLQEHVLKFIRSTHRFSVTELRALYILDVKEEMLHKKCNFCRACLQRCLTWFRIRIPLAQRPCMAEPCIDSDLLLGSAHAAASSVCGGPWEKGKAAKVAIPGGSCLAAPRSGAGC